MAGFCPPLKVTSPTPGSCDILGTSRVSARSSTAVRGSAFDVNPSVRIGASAGFTLLYTGGLGRSLGRNDEAAFMAACTCCSAMSRARLRSNWSVITELVLELVDVICLRPGI